MDELTQESARKVDITTLHTTCTKFNADVVEWCPHEPFQNYFVCANYELNDSNSGAIAAERLGRIILYSVTHENGLKTEQIIETQGILDVKWCHNKINGHSTLAAATSNNKVAIYKLNAVGINLECVLESQICVSDTDVLILSIDWSTAKHFSNNPELVCSDSKGNIHRLMLEDNVLEVKKSWNAHLYQAWIAAFSYWDTNITFTGGDDALLKKFDNRVDNAPVAVNKQAGAGVTSIHCNKSKENFLVTGSYDEHVRLWDDRNLRTPLHDAHLPGPVWRLKWDPFQSTEIIAACMSNGVHILQNSADKLNIVGSYFGHKDIAYGVDWSYLPKTEVQKLHLNCDRLIASCSFYDRLLCVAQYNIIM